MTAFGVQPLKEHQHMQGAGKWCPLRMTLTRIHHGCDAGLLSILVHFRALHWKAQVDPGSPRQLTAQAAQWIWPEDCQSLPVRTQGNAP